MMALTRLNEHARGACVRNYDSPFDIPTYTAVAWDEGEVAQRFGNAMGPGVRRLRSTDTFADIAGCTRDQRIDGTVDVTAPASGGLGPTEITSSGYAWLRCLREGPRRAGHGRSLREGSRPGGRCDRRDSRRAARGARARAARGRREDRRRRLLRKSELLRARSARPAEDLMAKRPRPKPRQLPPELPGFSVSDRPAPHVPRRRRRSQRRETTPPVPS